jgi:hypothetical protein
MDTTALPLLKECRVGWEFRPRNGTHRTAGRETRGPPPHTVPERNREVVHFGIHQNVGIEVKTRTVESSTTGQGKLYTQAEVR